MPGRHALARLDRHGERASRTATRSWPPSGRGRARRSARASARGRSAARPRLAMKLIASGVTNCGRHRRGRPRSRGPRRRTTTTILPCADVLERLLDRGERRLRAGHAARGRRQLLDVLGQHVHLQVHGRPGRGRAEGRALERLGDQRHGERRRRRPRRRSARRRRRRSSPSRRRSAAGSGRRLDRRRCARSRPRARRATAPSAVDVALDDVAAEPVVGAQRQLEVDPARPAPTSRERRAPQRLVHHVGAEALAVGSPTAVRQTPLTATESPSRELARPAASRTRRRTPSAVASTRGDRRRGPATSPVNTRSPLPAGAR